MKKGIAFLIVSACLFVSCNNENKKKIKISSDYNDYQIKEKEVIEENKREEFGFGKMPKNLPIDSSWLLSKPIIDEMSNDEYIILQYRSQGCFGGESKKIVLKKTDSKIFCILGSGVIMQLTESQIANFRKFESLLYQINKNSNFCTTVKTYAFYMGRRLRTYVDDTCEHESLLQPLVNNILLFGIPFEN